MAPPGVFLACIEVRCVRSGMASSVSHCRSGGHFCDRFFAAKSRDKECMYDREPDRTIGPRSSNNKPGGLTRHLPALAAVKAPELIDQPYWSAA